MSGRVLPAKLMNQVVFRPAIPVSAVPVLPPTVKPGSLSCGAGAALDDAPHHRRDLLGRLGLDRAAESVFLRAHDDRPVRRDDAVDDVGPHHDAVVRDRRGDHRHLQRRHEQPLLAEGEPARIDLGVLLRVEEPAFPGRGRSAARSFDGVSSGGVE